MNPTARMQAWVGGAFTALPDQYDDLDACAREALEYSKRVEEPIASRYRQYAAICMHIHRIVDDLRSTSAKP